MKLESEFTLIKGNEAENCYIDNTVIMLHDACIQYSRSDYCTYNNTETQLGVFRDTVFVKDGNRMDPCGVFQKKISDKSSSFYYRVKGKVLLVHDFEPSEYVYYRIYVFDPSRNEYISLNWKPQDKIPVEKLVKAIFILRTSSTIYYLDERSGFQMLKIVGVDKHIDVDLSKDGHKLFLRNKPKNYIPGNFIPSPFKSFNISDGIPRLIINARFDKKSLNNVQPDLHKKVHYYFTADFSVPSMVAYKYARDNLDYKILPNEFEDDDTENIDVIIDCHDKDSIGLYRFINSKMKKNYSIYGLSVSMILNAGLETLEYNRYMMDKTSRELKSACEDLLTKLMEKHGFNKTETAEYLWKNYCTYEILPPRFTYIDSPAKQGKLKAKYNEIYNEMVLKGEMDTKWKNETDLFRLINNVFEKTIYQYRNPEILGLQSLDVYVPEYSLAFEYQGIQHYEPVDFFGGEEALKKRQALDDKKRLLCKEHSITLIEWRYDEPISKQILNRKLNAIGMGSIIK